MADDTLTRQRALAGLYLDIKQVVVDAGFAQEIDWQFGQELGQVTESEFLRESGWVVLCSGMRETVVRSVFPDVSKAFLMWESARAIHRSRIACKRKALRAFGHSGKVNAILGIAAYVHKRGFEVVVSEIVRKGSAFLTCLPFMGPVTSLHLAKNIGLHVVKPDRHLVRLAEALRRPSVQALCEEVASFLAEPVAVVDIVLWRYATLRRDYVGQLQRAYARSLETCTAGS